MESDALAEKSFTHVFNLINYLPNSSKWIKLKLDYALNCELYQDQGNLSMTKDFERSLTHCPTCFNRLDDKTRKAKVIPERKRRFASRLLKRVENKGALTRYQAKYLKRMDKHVGNVLVITCGICNSEIKKNLKKPLKKIIVSKTACKDTPKSKKKRKKDRFAGLNQKAILSASVALNNSNACGAERTKSNVDTVVHTIKNKIKNGRIQKQQEKAKQKKKIAKTNGVLSKLSKALNVGKNSKSSSDLSSFLSSL